MSLLTTPLFDVSVRHSYFASGDCRAADLRPLPESLPLLSRHGLLWRPAQGGGALHRSVEPGEEDDLAFGRQWRETVPIRFGLRIADPHFATLTDIAVAPEGESAAELAWPVFFSNDAAQVTTTGSPANALLLHDSAAPCDRRISPDALGKSFVSGAQLPFAVVEIHLGGALGPALATGTTVLDGSGTITPRHYVIALSTRSTFVRYHLSRSLAAPMDNVRLTLEGQIDAAFTATTSAPSSAHTLQFISDRPIPLLESPSGTYRVMMIDGDGRVIKLPYASVQGTYPESAGAGAEPRFVSDVYVQL